VFFKFAKRYFFILVKKYQNLFIMKKKILLAFMAMVVAIQFFRPERNNSDIQTNHISKATHVPENVAAILKVGCYDCHSNKTNYTWPFNIQPTAWWMAYHVRTGKKHFNFSEFSNQPIAAQVENYKDIVNAVQQRYMPLPSYYYLSMHKGLELSETQRQTLINWANTQIDSLGSKNPGVYMTNNN
jgi:hypothetical protein